MALNMASNLLTYLWRICKLFLILGVNTVHEIQVIGQWYVVSSHAWSKSTLPVVGQPFKVKDSEHLSLDTRVRVLRMEDPAPQSTSFSLIFINSRGVWAKSSSKSGGLLYIFTCSNLHILTSSHAHIFSSSPTHTFISSHLLNFTYSHLQIFTPSHLHIFTSSHLHTSSLSLALILHIFTSSHPLTFTYTHLHIFSLSLSALSLSLSLALCHGLSLLLFLVSLEAAGSADEEPRYMATRSNEMRFECQKLLDFCDFTCSAATLSNETRFECQTLMFFFANLVGPAVTLSPCSALCKSVLSCRSVYV